MEEVHHAPDDHSRLAAACTVTTTRLRRATASERLHTRAQRATDAPGPASTMTAPSGPATASCCRGFMRAPTPHACGARQTATQTGVPAKTRAHGCVCSPCVPAAEWRACRLSRAGYTAKGRASSRGLTCACVGRRQRPPRSARHAPRRTSPPCWSPLDACACQSELHRCMSWRCL
jgi:hypothetical protein